MDELQTEAGKRHVARADAIYSKPRDEDGYRLLVTRYSDLLAIEAEAIAIGAAQERERLRAQWRAQKATMAAVGIDPMADPTRGAVVIAINTWLSEDDEPEAR